MNYSEPDYSKCSYQDLQGVYKHIDRDKYPERFKRVKALLSAKETAIRNDSKNQNVGNTQDYWADVSLGMVVGEMLIWVFIGVAAFLGYSVF